MSAVINNFAQFDNLPIDTRMSIYRMVSIQIIVSGAGHDNNRAHEIEPELVATIQHFLDEYYDHSVYLTRNFLNEYRNHVVKTMVAALKDLDLFMRK